MNFKALIINQQDENFTREVKNIDSSFLKHGNVLVKVDYSSLNYKDGMILKNGGKLVKEYPHIPGIDFAGTVEDSQSDKFKKGDKVILTGWRVGEIYFGGYSQYAKVQDDFLVKMPSDIDSKKAMILGTAGLTALMCVLAIQARETILLGEPVKDVLVTGATGGVGSVAVLALSKLGYNVSAVTGKKDKADFLKSLGAKTILDRQEMDQDARPLDKALYDGVVDTTGGKILAKALSHTKPNGIVAACGLASSFKLETTVMPFLIRGVKLWGIDSVTAPTKRREFLWSQATTYIDFEKLLDGVEEWSLDDLAKNSSKILKGEIAGRVIVNVNK
ncbi:MAG: MDR family oxidoreductase [Pelagibacteraceae bacterium]|jgi:acrylyl-CoA reductase (NADPH)